MNMSRKRCSMLDKKIMLKIEALKPEDWRTLIELTVEVIRHKKRFATLAGGEEQEYGTIVVPHTVEAPIVGKVRDFFYEHDLVVNFDWVSWDRGRELFNSQWENNFDKVSLTDVIKLFTAVIRNDRFCEGAFAGIFDSGDAEKLLRRLVQFNKVEYDSAGDWMLDNLRLHIPPGPDFIPPPGFTELAEKEILDNTNKKDAK
jgi:hypothetical protein